MIEDLMIQDLTIQDLNIAAIEEYKQHPSILKITKHIKFEDYFGFKHIDDKKWQRY